ncbi:VOC family protein, partial [Rhizobium leguminosarum]
RHLGLKLKDMRGQNGLEILEDDAGLEIILSQAIEKFGTADQVEMGRQTYHIGFILPERADVDAVHDGLADAGADLSG